jgi:hypothetical protein
MRRNQIWQSLSLPLRSGPRRSKQPAKGRSNRLRCIFCVSKLTKPCPQASTWGPFDRPIDLSSSSNLNHSLQIVPSRFFSISIGPCPWVDLESFQEPSLERGLEHGHSRAFVLLGILVFRQARELRHLPVRLPATSGPLARVALALVLASGSLPLRAQNGIPAEYLAKANYLANFPSFVEWPPQSLPAGHAPFLVCVFGDFSFGTSLAESTRAAQFQERHVEVRWVRKPQDLLFCQIVFVSRSERKGYNRALDVVRGRMILTIGETPDFLDAGGILSFSGQPSAIQFDVNLGAAKTAQLQISSRLLALARRVVNQTEAGKS